MKNANTEHTVKGEYISPSCACINVKIENSILSGDIDSPDNTIIGLGEAVDLFDSIWM